MEGDHSSSPALTVDVTVSGYPDKMEIGNVDNDNYKELVLKSTYGDVQIWDFTYNNGIICENNTYTVKISNVGSLGLTVGNTDGDSCEEIIVGDAYDENGIHTSKAVILDYQNGQYVRAAYIGSRIVDDISVGELDGNSDNGNEIFMSGAMSDEGGPKVCIWRYGSNGYSEVWSGNYETCPSFNNLQSNEIADIDGDGKNEAVAGTEHWNEKVKGKVTWYYRLFVWMWNADSKTWIKSIHTPPCSGALDAAVSGNVDGTGGSELVFGGTVLKWDDEKDTLVNIQTMEFKWGPSLA